MPQDDRPVVQQVVALVEHHRADAGRDEAVHQRAGVVVQPAGDRGRLKGVPQRLAAQAGGAAAQLAGVGVGVGRRHRRDAVVGCGGIGDAVGEHQLVAPGGLRGSQQVRGRGARRRQRLVGQDGDGRDPRGVGAHQRPAGGPRRQEEPDLVTPLADDRGGGREHHQRAPAAACELQPQQRLARPGRRAQVQHVVGPSGGRVGGREEPLLVAPQRHPQGHCSQRGSPGRHGSRMRGLGRAGGPR